MVTTPVLVLPGYGDSGPEHWQSRWQAAGANFRRVLQRDWLMPERAEWLATLEREVAGVTHVVLAAISVGSVAMGANSYIGNAPNFMVKSIAEEAKIPMPSFFGYMLYSGAILLPLFAIVTLLFFR